MTTKPPAITPRRVIALVATLAAAAAVWWMVSESRALAEISNDLNKGIATRRLMDLQLAPNSSTVRRILTDWASPHLSPPHNVTETARAAIERDGTFIVSYVLAGVLLTLAASILARPPWPLVLVVVVCFLAGGEFDRRENVGLQQMIDSGGYLEGVVLRTQLYALGKFIALALGVIGLLVFIGGAIRRLFGRALAESSAGHDFAELLKLENAAIFAGFTNRPPDEPKVEPNTATDEPRVSFRAADVIGLALSGGGIRSATFNFGLLQELHSRNLLAMFDYLSTVSGGGYIGAFWSAWLQRARVRGDHRLFPARAQVSAHDYNRHDSAEERHLREFSGFLAPRWGVFEVETWTAIVALIAGLVPSVLTALSVIGLLLLGWLSLTFPLAVPGWAALVTIGGITAGALAWFELLWHSVKVDSAGSLATLPRPGQTLSPTSQDTANRRAERRWYLGFAALAFVAVLFVFTRLPVAWLGDLDKAPGLERWWSMVLGDSARDGFAWSRSLFTFSLVWLGVAFGLVLLRLVFPLAVKRWSARTMAAFDRVVMRLLGLAAFWAGAAVVWHLTMNAANLLSYIAAAALASGGAFALLRNWIGVALRRPEDGGVLTRLKPYLPQVLAYVTIVLTAILVGQLLIRIGGTDWLSWWATGGVMLLFVTLTLFINPAEYGLHAFYRDRLSRAFSGACNLEAGQGAEDNRATDARVGDDPPLCTLVPRPLHLVCCAANDLSGDMVETLARGARSAVLSRHGLSVGDYSRPAVNVTLGAAITASAAAFNSNMGMVSMRVGPAVSFLMTALNLRLGLWVRHPAASSEVDRRWPGLLIYREMFGLTSASGRIGRVERPVAANTKPGPELIVPSLMRDLHLSDGAHFENLSLYELVRRHCRYILVSDCGADPTVAFDDLGNAVRRVREDFGVDISIDVTPLRPNATGVSERHVAIGTIHYSSLDRGIVIYIKPTLTGDEPPDVLQYKTRNAAFPHESTGDQFYDEAQYESYRRLGRHVAEQVFSFVPPDPAVEPGAGGGPVTSNAPRPSRPLTADWVFAQCAHTWGATPGGLIESILRMTERFGELEMDLQRHSRDRILREVFPELAFVATDAPEPSRGALALAADPADLPFFIRVTQLMEDTWMACQLDEWWDHPLNLGWVNMFARWATAPSFRFWWPMLSPMYSPGFNAFINQRFPIPTPRTQVAGAAAAINVPQRGRLERLHLTADHRPGLAELWWTHRSTQPRRWKNRALYQNLAPLPRPGGPPLEIQVGLAAVALGAELACGTDVGWSSDDFFVPPSLWGAGFGWYFLNDLLRELARNGHCNCYVVVTGVPRDAHHKIALDDRRSFSEQYRKIGFRQQLTASNPLVITHLKFNRETDTLFHMDLQLWAERRGESLAT
jgi:hypothetical protein